MVGLLDHRGPDGHDLYTERPDDRDGVSLGHSRLSIIDLSAAGTEPMPNEDETVWLSFNGEIYNFRELRESLLSRGHTFRSHCDAEVILHLETYPKRCAACAEKAPQYQGCIDVCDYDNAGNVRRRRFHSKCFATGVVG